VPWVILNTRAPAEILPRSAHPTPGGQMPPQGVAPRLRGTPEDAADAAGIFYSVSVGE